MRLPRMTARMRPIRRAAHGQPGRGLAMRPHQHRRYQLSKNVYCKAGGPWGHSDHVPSVTAPRLKVKNCCRSGADFAGMDGSCVVRAFAI